MTDAKAAKPKYANFPERELKVVIGPNINATTIKTLTRLSIGTYEMSFSQQEKATVTTEAARVALSAVAKPLGIGVTRESSKEFVGIFTAANDDQVLKVWVTTPFELTQAAHIVWVKWQELGGEKKTGVAFKISTGFTADDIIAVIKTAQKNAVVLAAGEPFTLKGNPPPRFQKKAKTETSPTPGE